MVATDNLTKGFGERRVLSDVALKVPTGSAYLLLGRNGAGKSTLLRILLGLMRVDTGTASVCGLDPARDAASVRANIGYVPEQTDWGHRWMRVGRLLQHHASYFEAWSHEYEQRLTDTLEIDRHKRMSALSKGEMRRVHLVMALAHRPPLLMLDEPIDGLDERAREDVIEMLVAHRREFATTIVIATHYVGDVVGFVDHVGLLRDGQLALQRTVADLLAHPSAGVGSAGEKARPLAEMAAMLLRGEQRSA
jgi:ABC-2 type transport system ATP-binding protein